MPPSGPLLTLYPAEHGTPPGVPASATSPLRLKHTDLTKVQVGDPENTHPNSSRFDAGTSQQSLVFATQSAPFLEMEEDEDETDKVDVDALDNLPINERGITENNNLLLPVAAADADAPQEGSKEMECPVLTARYSPRSLPTSRPRSVSCGKRSRNIRQVSFASGTQLASKSLQAANPFDSRQRCGKNSLLRVCETIHLSDYTPEERLATWYTLADLRSFKKERKETARQVDSGLLPLRRSADQTSLSDIFVDTTSFGEPVEYCSRGVENCTEAASRIRYRHICDGWRNVLNAQEKHNYQQRRLASMSSSEKQEYNALAIFLGVGKNKASRKTTFNIWGTGSKSSPRSSPKSSQADPFQNMCCPYDLAAVYLPSSDASLTIARNRAISDERDALAQREEDRLELAAKENQATAAKIDSGNAFVNNGSVQHNGNGIGSCDDIEKDAKQYSKTASFQEGKTRTMDL